MSTINVSRAAQEYFKKLLDSQDMEGLAIRLSATNAGTPGVECGILYCPKEYITANDEHFQMDGFEIVIDSGVSEYLDESVIDLDSDDKGEDILTFHAPNLKKSPLPADASLKDRLALFFERSVNPELAAHGGYVELVDATEDGVVKVRFAGGCNGCSMVGLTLSEGIQGQLNRAFPGLIKELIDVTEHVKSEESYA